MKTGDRVRVVKDTYFFTPVGSIGTIDHCYDEEHGTGPNRLYSVMFVPGEVILFREHEIKEVIDDARS